MLPPKRATRTSRASKVTPKPAISIKLINRAATPALATPPPTLPSQRSSAAVTAAKTARALRLAAQQSKEVDSQCTVTPSPPPSAQSVQLSPIGQFFKDNRELAENEYSDEDSGYCLDPPRHPPPRRAVLSPIALSSDPVAQPVQASSEPADRPSYTIFFKAMVGKETIKAAAIQREEAADLRAVKDEALERARGHLDCTGLAVDLARSQCPQITLKKKGHSSITLDIHDATNWGSVDKAYKQMKPTIVELLWQLQTRNDPSNVPPPTQTPSQVVRPVVALSSTQRQRATLEATQQMAELTQTHTIAIAAQNKCGRNDCPHKGESCYYTASVHVPIGVDLMRKWAEAISKGKAEATNPGDDLIAPWVKLAKEKHHRRQQKESKQAPKRPLNGSPERQRQRGFEGGGSTMYFNFGTSVPSYSPQQWAMPSSSYGQSSMPSFPVQQHQASSPAPPLCRKCSGGEEDDQDDLLRQYCDWLKKNRRTKATAIETLYNSLEEADIAFDQLARLDDTFWNSLHGGTYGIILLFKSKRKGFIREVNRMREAARARGERSLGDASDDSLSMI